MTSGPLVKYIDDTIVGGYLPGQLFSSQWLSEALVLDLPLLGSRFISPLASRLRELGITQVMLIPTGRLGLLPLHSVSYEKDDRVVCLLDEWSVGYAPSARALTTIQREFLERKNIPLRLAGVGNPLPDSKDAAWAKNELEQVLPDLRRAVGMQTSRVQGQAGRSNDREGDRLQSTPSEEEEILKSLHILCQQPVEEFLHSGRLFSHAVTVLANLPDLSRNTVTTLFRVATRIPPSLDFAFAELENIQALLPPEKFTLLYGERATREAFLEQLSFATIAHCACHGSFNAEVPLDSSLLLAQGTSLTLGDLLNLEPRYLARLRLVFLSACQTAVTDFQRVPDEVVGLLSGFLQAGVPSVIGTLWSVNDLSTALLATRFYELYLQGDPPASALRFAQLWLRDLSNYELQAYLINSAQRFSPALVASLLPSIRVAVRQGKGDERPYADPRFWAAFAYYGVL